MPPTHFVHYFDEPDKFRSRQTDRSYELNSNDSENYDEQYLRTKIKIEELGFQHELLESPKEASSKGARFRFKKRQ